MEILTLFCYFIFISSEFNQINNKNNKIFISPGTNFSDLDISNLSNNDIEFIVFNTSYSNQIMVDLTSDLFYSLNFSCCSFKPFNDSITEYIYLKTNFYTPFNLNFISILVTFSLNNLYLNNLTLLESPISSQKEKINLTVDYFKSDFHSIPQNTVSSIYINKEFIFLEKTDNISNKNLINSENSLDKHAIVILSTKAKQKFVKIQKDPSPADNIIDFLDFTKLNELIEKVRQENSMGSEKVQLLNDESSESETITDTNSTIDDDFTSFTPSPSPDDFDNETNITEKVDFVLNSSLSTLEIYNDEVVAIYENQGKETIETNSTGHLNIYTDSKSLTLKYSGDINFLNNLKLNIFLTSESIIIFDQSWRIFGDQVITNIALNHEQSQLLTLMTDLDEVPYVTVVPMLNVRYVPERQLTESYCLCLKNRIEECIENRECFLYSVPVENYYSSSSSVISDIVANSKSQTINIYLTFTTLNDFHQFLIRPFFRGRKNLNFISVDTKNQVNLVIFDLSEKRDRNKVIVSCSDLTNLMASFSYDNSIDTLVLKNCPLVLIRPLSIHNLVSDAYSLKNRQSMNVYIIESFTINSAEWNTVGINFILRDGAFFSMEQISMFPGISLSQSQVSFTGNEGEFSVAFEGSCGVKISEITNCNPTVFISSDAPANAEIKVVIDFILVNSLVIDFTHALPFPNGVEINFIPNDDVLNSLELIMFDSTNFFDTPSDASSFRLFPFGNITGNIDLILSSSESVQTFMNSLRNNDFSVSNLTQISMNFNDNLVSVTFFDESIIARAAAGVNYSMELQFDRLFITGQMTIISNTSDTIVMALNYTDYLNITEENNTIDFEDAIPGLTSKMQDFVLKSTNEKSSSIFFDDTFLPFMNNPVLSKIKIDHGTNNVALKTNLSTVPNIEVLDDVSGVLYYAQLCDAHLNKSFNDTEIDYNAVNLSLLFNRTVEIYRSGPNMTVYIEKSGIFVNQNQFLAENVTFVGESFVFLTKTKSRCIYNFVDIPSVLIVPGEKSIGIDFEFKTLINATDFFDSILKQSLNIENVLYTEDKHTLNDKKIDDNNELDYENLLMDGPNIFTNPPDYSYLSDDLNLNNIFTEIYNNHQKIFGINASLYTNFFRATYLNLCNTSLTSQTSSTSQVLFLFNYLKSDLTSLTTLDPKQITVATDIFTLADDKMQQVTIDGKSLSGTFCDSSLINCKTPFVTSSIFLVHYAMNDTLTVSLQNKTISSRVFFIMESKTSVSVYLDSTWYQCNGAEYVTFIIVNAKVKKNGQKSIENLNVTIETALYEMPNIRVVDSSFSNVSYMAKLYDPLFDANMSFYIFVSLAAAVAVISIVFLCISIFCYKKFEIEDEKSPNDVSSSRKSTSKMKITATVNNSSDSSEDEENNALKLNKLDTKNDESSQADDESSGTLDIDVDFF